MSDSGRGYSCSSNAYSIGGMIFMAILAKAWAAATPAGPTALRTGFSAPAGAVVLAVPCTEPLVLSWQNIMATLPSRSVPTATRGIVQTAYEVELDRIVEAGVPKSVWRSGTVASAVQRVRLNASLLLSDADYRWRVCTTLVGSTDAPEPTCSERLRFSTAPSAASWTRAMWIGGKQQLRSDFEIPSGRTPVRARLHASGVGAFYVWLNGKQLGDHVLDPPQSVYPYGIMCALATHVCPHAHPVWVGISSTWTPARQIRLLMCCRYFDLVTTPSERC
eukprot:SAG31_NODE_242_length_19350_cov_3.043998_14_plen_277_part_00